MRMQFKAPEASACRRASNDNAPHPRPPLTGRRLRDDILMGIRFYSRLPTGDRAHEVPDLHRMAPALPFVSLMLALGPAVILSIGAQIGLPGPAAAAIAVLVGVMITGAMAEDALADAADGLFGGATPERRLEIMKDPRHGTYGISALCLLLILRVFILAGLISIGPLDAFGAWIAASILGRSGALWLAAKLPSARRSGLSATVGRLGMTPFCMGAALALALTFIFAGPVAGMLGLGVAVLACLAVASGWAKLVRSKVGGQTGDLIGALQALLEISALLVLLIFA